MEQRQEQNFVGRNENIFFCIFFDAYIFWESARNKMLHVSPSCRVQAKIKVASALKGNYKPTLKVCRVLLLLEVEVFIADGGDVVKS